VLICNDARMQEVYWTCATRGPGGLALARAPEQVSAPDKVKLPSTLERPVVGAGRGFAVWTSLRERLRGELMQIEAELLPSAREIARLAVPTWLAGQGAAPEQAQPVYLRNDVAKPSRK
jgi:tRNA threonylcarbamoyladenosine biosynthesis protein TsaB